MAFIAIWDPSCLIRTAVKSFEPEERWHRQQVNSAYLLTRRRITSVVLFSVDVDLSVVGVYKAKKHAKENAKHTCKVAQSDGQTCIEKSDNFGLPFGVIATQAALSDADVAEIRTGSDSVFNCNGAAVINSQSGLAGKISGLGEARYLSTISERGLITISPGYY